MNKSKVFVSLTLGAFLILVGGAVADAGNNKGHDGNHGHNDKESGLRNDFALFDGSNPANQPDSGAVCGAKADHPFTYYLAVANYGSDGFVRITYADGDWVQFPINAGGSFNLTQAAGSKSGNDAVVRVSNGASAAQLAGVMSAQGATCGSCDAVAQGGIADAGCDALAPN
jgi:hypothetical protein